MTKREAKRRVCQVTSAIVGNAAAEGWDALFKDDEGEPYVDEDLSRLETAATELSDELLRRGGG